MGRYVVSVFCLALSLGLSQGCARSEALHPESGPASHKQELPFHPDAEQGAANEGAGPAVPPDAKSPAGLPGALPFRASSSNGRVVPAGTLLTVHLQGTLSTARVRVGDAFTAVVAAPLTIEGVTLIPSGAAVTGRVESEQSQAGMPGLIPGSGYFRLTLSTISIDGKQIDLQTSSLFAKGTVQPANSSASSSSSDAHLENVRVRKGRTLTFRLTAPLSLDYGNSTATDQHPSRGTN